MVQGSVGSTYDRYFPRVTPIDGTRLKRQDLHVACAWEAKIFALEDQRKACFRKVLKVVSFSVPNPGSQQRAVFQP
jgi:hypothetical protein